MKLAGILSVRVKIKREKTHIFSVSRGSWPFCTTLVSTSTHTPNSTSNKSFATCSCQFALKCMCNDAQICCNGGNLYCSQLYWYLIHYELWKTPCVKVWGRSFVTVIADNCNTSDCNQSQHFHILCNALQIPHGYLPLVAAYSNSRILRPKNGGKSLHYIYISNRNWCA